MNQLIKDLRNELKLTQKDLLSKHQDYALTVRKNFELLQENHALKNIHDEDELAKDFLRAEAQRLQDELAQQISISEKLREELAQLS